MRPWIQLFWQQFGRIWRLQHIAISVAWTLIEQLSEMRKEQSFCQRFWHALAKEFSREKFNLTHQPSDDFFKSQWQRHNRSLIWLVYRLCLAACFCGGVLGSVIQQFKEGKWFIYLTDWGFTLCMYTSIFGAVLVSIYYCKAGKVSKLTPIGIQNSLQILVTLLYVNYLAVSDWVLKLYWVSHWSTLVLATLITFVYWSFIYPTDNQSAAALYNLWAHGFNSVLMILDHLLVAFPSRILHCVYPLALGFIYLLFTLIFYFAGGVDANGNVYIYEILDWSKPQWAVLTGVGCLLMSILFSCLHFGLFKLRWHICSNLKRKNSVLQQSA